MRLPPNDEDREMQAVAEEIEALTAELRDTSMGMRTLPLRSTFERFKRLVYDLGRSLHKEVELTFDGGETELDKTVLDQLNDPLMHLIRNSMDHGIEEPETRRAAGKPTTARSTCRRAMRAPGADLDLRRRKRYRPRGGAGARARKGPDRRGAKLTRVRNLLADHGARFFDRQDGHRCVGPRRGHGRCQPERGCLAGNDRHSQPARRGVEGHASAAADAGHHRRAAGAGGRGAFRHAAGQYPGMRRADAARHRDANGKHLANMRGEIIPYIRLQRVPADAHRRGRSSSR